MASTPKAFYQQIYAVKATNKTFISFILQEYRPIKLCKMYTNINARSSNKDLDGFLRSFPTVNITTFIGVTSSISSYKTVNMK